MRDWFLRVGLSYQVSVGVAILMMGALLVLGLQAVRVSRENAFETLEEQVLRLTGATAVAADGWLRHEITQFEQVATQSSLVEAGHSPASETALLGDLHTALLSYSYVSLRAADGTAIASHPVAAGARLSGDEMAELVGRAIERGVVVGRTFAMADGTAGEVVLAVRVPRVDGAQPVLVGRLRLFDRAEELLPSVREGFPIAVAVIDGRGVRLAGEHDAAILSGHLLGLAASPGSEQLELKLGDGDGERHFLTFAPLEMIPAGIMLEFPEAMFVHAADDLTLTILLLGLAALAVSAISAWVHSRWVTGPLRRLEVATRRLAAGDRDEPMVLRRTDEIGRLSESFEEMRRQLREVDEERTRWEGQLEHRVAERTRDVRRLLRVVIDAQERERGRLARELHDDTAQTLATSLVAIRAVRSSLDGADEQQRKLIDNVLEQGRATLADVRRIVMDLRPTGLDEVGLAEALRSWADQRLQVSGTRLEAEIKGAPVALNQAAEIALFRIVQEAVNNVVRHANADNAWLRIAYDQDGLRIDLRDDGDGFDPAGVAAMSATGGVGLQSMTERAGILGASLELESEPGKGTAVRLRYEMEEDGADE
jgi:signal transduction histidine kinase